MKRRKKALIVILALLSITSFLYLNTQPIDPQLFTDLGQNASTKPVDPTTPRFIDIVKGLINLVLKALEKIF